MLIDKQKFKQIEKIDQQINKDKYILGHPVLEYTGTPCTRVYWDILQKSILRHPEVIPYRGTLQENIQGHPQQNILGHPVVKYTETLCNTVYWDTLLYSILGHPVQQSKLGQVVIEYYTRTSCIRVYWDIMQQSILGHPVEEFTLGHPLVDIRVYWDTLQQSILEHPMVEFTLGHPVVEYSGTQCIYVYLESCMYCDTLCC